METILSLLVLLTVICGSCATVCYCFYLYKQRSLLRQAQNPEAGALLNRFNKIENTLQETGNTLTATNNFVEEKKPEIITQIATNNEQGQRLVTSISDLLKQAQNDSSLPLKEKTVKEQVLEKIALDQSEFTDWESTAEDDDEEISNGRAQGNSSNFYPPRNNNNNSNDSPPPSP